MVFKTSSSDRQRQVLLTFTGALLTVLLVTGVGWAHAFLESATPAEGSRLQTAPKELRLSFTEPIEVAFSRVTVIGPDGQNVAQPITQSGITRTITVPLNDELPPGEYTVQWQVLSIDTHTTNGQFKFTVLGDPATARQQEAVGTSNASDTAPQPESAETSDTFGTATQQEAATSEVQKDAGGFAWGWTVAIGAVVVGGGLIVFLRGRR